QLGLAPGPGLTGVAFGVPARNQLAAFRVVYPEAARVGVIYSPANTARLGEGAEKAAAVVRINLVTKAITSEKEGPGALRALLGGPQPVDAVWLIPEPLLLGDEARRYVLSETLKVSKPTFAFSSSVVAEGALVSSGPDFTSIGEKAGELVNRLAAGERRIGLRVPNPEPAVETRVPAQLKSRNPAW